MRKGGGKYTPPNTEALPKRHQKQEEAAGAQALPDGWERLASPSYPGRYFYSHAATGKSQWEVPQ